MKNENQRNSLKSIWKLNDELSEKNKRLEETINKQQILINKRIADISDLNNKIEEKKKQINTLYTKQAYLKAKNIAFYITLKRVK
jgi:predicted  nucleic acid-binding Zn-ribbon protein